MLSTFLLTVGAVAVLVGLCAVYAPAAAIVGGLTCIALGIGLWRADGPSA